MNLCLCGCFVTALWWTESEPGVLDRPGKIFFLKNKWIGKNGQGILKKVYMFCFVFKSSGIHF